MRKFTPEDIARISFNANPLKATVKKRCGKTYQVTSEDETRTYVVGLSS